LNLHVAAVADPNRFMIDVSVLLTETGLAWIEESEGARSSTLVSAAFYETLSEAPDELFMRFADPEQRDFFSYAREVLPSRLEPVEKFTHRSIPVLPRRHEAIRRRLLGVGGLEGELMADEFVYLVSQSWLVAKTRKILDELRRAGVRVREYADEVGGRFVHEMIAAVIPEAKIPEELTPEVIKRAGIKWIVVGGVGGLTAAATGLIGFAGGLLVRPVVRAFDP
jgi:hypothetical protein